MNGHDTMKTISPPVLLLGVLLAGCPSTSGTTPEPAARASNPASAPRAVGSDEAVAVVNGEPITEAELLAAAKGELSQAEAKYAEEIRAVKSRTLDALIEGRLLAARAKSEGITVEELLVREVDAKLPEPTEDYLQEVYRLTKESGRVVPPFAEARAEIVTYVKGRVTEDKRRAYMSGLRAAAKVESFLPPPLLPRVEMKPDGPSRGDAAAPVTLVAFSDYECQFCATAESIVSRVLSEYPAKVRFVFQSFPLSIHKEAVKASEAALCAGEQGKYWEMHGTLFSNQKQLSVDDLKRHARALALDGAAFDRCLDSGSMAARVEASRRLGERANVSSTPTFFVNGRPATTSSYEMVKELIDYELAHPAP